MRVEAASAGYYETAWGSHPRLQLLTVADLLGGHGIDRPYTAGVNKTFKAAPKGAVAAEAALLPSLFDAPRPTT